MVSMGQESGHSLAGSLTRILPSYTQGIGWAMFSFGGLMGEELPSCPFTLLPEFISLWLYEEEPSFLPVIAWRFPTVPRGLL